MSITETLKDTAEVMQDLANTLRRLASEIEAAQSASAIAAKFKSYGTTYAGGAE